MTNPIDILSASLCELYPTDLDAFCLDFPVRLAMSNRDIAAMRYMAKTVLEHESLGDALARVQKYDGTL